MMVNDSVSQYALNVREPAVPAPKEFKPWHKPRKQFIREHQWGKAAKQLINDIGPDTVNYLTLPGSDFLDVITLGEVCEKLDKKLKFLGFDNSQDNAELLSQDIEYIDAKGRQLPILQESHLVNYNIEDIATCNSKAQRQFATEGPFHIVNLDTCSSFASQKDFENQSRIVDALKAIIEMQLTKCGNDWLLFLTTNLSHQNFNQCTFKKLMDAILKNAEESEEFATVAKKSMRLPPNTVLANVISQLPTIESEGFVRKCTLGISKWMLHLLQATQQKQWEIEVGDTYFYSTGDAPDMLSAVFRFKRLPQQLEDSIGLTTPNAVPIRNSKPADVRLATRLSYMRNLDDKLLANPECLTKITEKSAELLSLRGYPTGENHQDYIIWCQSNQN